MNLTSFNLYLITRLDPIHVFLLAVATAAVGAIGFLAMYFFIIPLSVDPDDKPVFLQWTKRMLAVATGCLLLSSFIPSTNDMLLILGVPAVLQSKAVQKDLPELYSKVIERLLEQIDKPNQESK